MKKFAVIRTGGKQYVVSEQDEIVVDRVPKKEGEELQLETMVRFDDAGGTVDLGTPILKKTTTSQIISHLKGDKIRVAKFKAKVRYRKVKGFRALLSKIKISKI